MGWSFEASCEDCGHLWEGCTASFHIGPGKWAWLADEGQSLFCPGCYYRLYLPRLLDRATWQRWYSGYLADSPPEWLSELLSHIDAGMAPFGMYTPQLVDPGPVNCPGCGKLMVSSKEHDHIYCPKCGSLRPVISAYTGHVCLFRSDDGFE